MQEGGRSLIFGFFPTPSQLIKTPTFIILAKGVKSPILFLCIKNRRQYLSRVLPILAVA